MTLHESGSDNMRRPTSAPQRFGDRPRAMLDSLAKRIEFLGKWKVSLAITVAVVLVIIATRYYYSFVTGYIVPDEAWYYDTFILDKMPVTSYREVFVAIFLVFFHGVNNVWTFLLRGVLYSSTWAVGVVVMFYAVLRRLKVPEKTSSLLILSLPLFPVFIILLPTVLTETPGLFFGLLGVYFCLKHVQEGHAIDSLLSGVFFVLAYKIREPYLLFAVGNVILFLVLAVKRRSLGSILGYAIPVSFVFPVPTSLEPLRFAQPLSNFLMNLISQLVPWGQQAGSTFPSATSQAPMLTPAFVVPITVAFHPDLPKALAIGLWYGFNPLFALFAGLSLFVVCLGLLMKRSSTLFFLGLNAIWSFGAFLVPVAITLQLLPGAISGWTSVIIRLTHPSLPCMVGFPGLYHLVKPRRIAALTLILLVLGSTQTGALAVAFQRSLSVEPMNRLNLDYRAPYYRMYLLAKESGKTLVFGGLHMRGIRMYMAMLPNVVLVPVAANETEFQTLLAQDWNAIFLYDDWVTIKIPSMMDAYPPYYAEILRSKQYAGYNIEPLWIDSESYALRMTNV